MHQSDATVELKPVAKNKVDDALRRVEELDLEPIAYLLVHDGASVDEADRKLAAYRRFLALVIAYPHVSLVPDAEADDALHAHIMDTELYIAQTTALFGHVMHHWPYLGRRDAEDEKRLQQQGEVTRKLIQTHFEDEEVPGDVHWCVYVSRPEGSEMILERPRLRRELATA